MVRTYYNPLSRFSYQKPQLDIAKERISVELSCRRLMLGETPRRYFGHTQDYEKYSRLQSLAEDKLKECMPIEEEKKLFPKRRVK